MRFIVDGQPAYAYTGAKAFDPALPCAVFIHGAQHDHSVWVLQSRYLAHHGFGVLALDLPGHGRSAGPPLPSIEAMADWVLAAVAEAGAKSASLIGHSMGSLIALEAAARGTKLIASAVLIGAAFPMKVSDALLEASRTDESRAMDMINVWSHSGVTHHPGSPGPGFSVFMQNRRLMERQAPGVLFNDFSACNAYAGGFERAAAITCPTLLLVGQRDQMTPPKAARELHRRIAHSAWVEVAGSGHDLMNEHPDEVRDAIMKFLAPVRGAATT
jgi:pimeloyl-ACP methyl ester carboxylesterase